MSYNQENHPSAPGLVQKPHLNSIAELASPVARTTTANLTGVDMIVTGPVRSFAILTAGTTTGTNPTLDVKLQESSDNSTFTDVVLDNGYSFSQITAAAAPQFVKFTRTKRYLRAVYTFGGTTPSIVSSVTVGQ